MREKPYLKSIFLLIAVIIAAAGCYLLSFHYDNKYTAKSAISQGGWTYISKESLSNPIYLVDGWELYPDKLLTPEQLVNEQNPLDTFVGEFLNISPLHGNRSPYGLSTWRLRIHYDGEDTVGTILLPEVFCSFKLYINGVEQASQGSVSPYQPQIKDTVVSFPLLTENEIVIQTANYTHYYSGVTYPPVFGTVEAVTMHTNIRLMFYGILCFGTLTAALFSIAFWASGSKRRDPMALLFGTMALGFAIWVSYPFTRLIGAPLIRPLYALEDAAFLLIIWCALRIVLHLCGLANIRLGQRLSSFAVSMLLVGVVIPLLILPAIPEYVALYGKLITAYRLLSSLLIAGLALYGGLKRRANSGWTLCGAGFFAAGLLAGALTVHSFEPAQFGWLEEYGALGLVICFGILMIQRNFLIVKENITLNEHLQVEVERKTHDLGLLISERDDLISKFLHDMKSPAAFMLSYVHMVRQNNVELDEQTLSQLKIIEEKCADLGDRIRQVQQYTVENPLITPHQEIDLCELLRDFYTFSKPDVEMDGQNFLLKLLSNPCRVLADSDKLERMLQNLIYNAVTYTPPDGEICLLLTSDDENAFLSVQDTGGGIKPDVLPHIFDRFYTTRAEDGGSGLGLYIVRTIAREHGGDVSVRSHYGIGTDFTVWIPLVQ